MVVERYVTPNPITVRPDTSLRKALELLQTHQIRHLPVIPEYKVCAVRVTPAD